MSSRKLSRAERRRQLRDERRELDPDQMAIIAHTVGRLEGFIDGYIIGKVGIESYRAKPSRKCSPSCQIFTARTLNVVPAALQWKLSAIRWKPTTKRKPTA